MKKMLFVLLFALGELPLMAQIENFISGSVSVAETSTADRRQWSAFHNPAMLGYSTHTELGATVENRFFIKELSAKIVQATLPAKTVNIGVGLSHFGYSVYHDMVVGVAVARNFSDRFAMGFQLNYFTSFFVQENRYRGAVLGQFGANIRLSESFSMAFNTFNPFNTKIRTEGVPRKLPAVYSIGTSCLFSENLAWRTQADRDLNATYRLATAFDYYFNDVFTLKLGIYGFEYLVSCLGVGLKFGNVSFDLNAELHPQLGVNTFGKIGVRL